MKGIVAILLLSLPVIANASRYDGESGTGGIVGLAVILGLFYGIYQLVKNAVGEEIANAIVFGIFILWMAAVVPLSLLILLKFIFDLPNDFIGYGLLVWCMGCVVYSIGSKELLNNSTCVDGSPRKSVACSMPADDLALYSEVP